MPLFMSQFSYTSEAWAGHVKAIKTTTLFTVEQAMTALRKAGTASYRAPTG